MIENIPERLLTSAQVREMLGGMSDMSLWRWLNNPTMGFPQPVRIARRRFWREAELKAWLEAQSPTGSARAA